MFRCSVFKDQDKNCLSLPESEVWSVPFKEGTVCGKQGSHLPSVPAQRRCTQRPCNVSEARQQDCRDHHDFSHLRFFLVEYQNKQFIFTIFPVYLDTLLGNRSLFWSDNSSTSLWSRNLFFLLLNLSVSFCLVFRKEWGRCLKRPSWQLEILQIKNPLTSVFCYKRKRRRRSRRGKEGLGGRRGGGPGIISPYECSAIMA